MKQKSTIGNLPVYKPGKPMEEVKRELGLTEVIKLASNENPIGASPKAKAAIERELSQLALYPDGAGMELRGALGQQLGVKGEQLIFGNGSDEIINMIARAFFVPGDQTVMAVPTFPQYRHNALIEGAEVIEVPLKDGTHDLEGMLAKVNEQTKIVWVCNPNNPTGTISTKEEFEKFLTAVPSHVLVVSDEAYSEYIDDPSYPDTIKLLDPYKNLLILRTFSKIYGLASLRIGYGVGHPEIIHLINQVREPFNNSRLAQAAALASVGDQEFVEACRKANREGLEFLQAHFDRWGLSYYPAYGNFIAVNVGRPAAEVFQRLLEKGFITRTDPSWNLPTTLRISVGTPEQNQKLVGALAQILNKP
jgi:histidinol-phosphate aminotransferase